MSKTECRPANQYFKIKKVLIFQEGCFLALMMMRSTILQISERLINFMFNPVLSSVLILLKMYMEINLKEHKLT